MRGGRRACRRQANGWAKCGAVCGQGARPAGVRRWARPRAGRAGEGSRASEARAQAGALCEAAAGVARGGWLTMAHRSKRSFFV